MFYFRMKPDLTFQSVDEDVYNQPSGAEWTDNKFSISLIGNGDILINEVIFKNVTFSHRENLIRIMQANLNYIETQFKLTT
jgi:hypothetical protein